jgi:hypothetical protein
MRSKFPGYYGDPYEPTSADLLAVETFDFDLLDARIERVNTRSGREALRRRDEPALRRTTLRFESARREADTVDHTLIDFDPEATPAIDAADVTETPVEQAVPAPSEFENDFVHDHSGRGSAAMLFASIAGLGVFLAVLATPIPVRIAGIVLAAIFAIQTARILSARSDAQ